MGIVRACLVGELAVLEAVRRWQIVGLVLVAAGAAALCYLALTRQYASDDQQAKDPGPSGSASATDSPSSSPTSSTPTADPQVPEPPEVKDQRRVDFADGDSLPDGAETYDGGGNASPLRVQGGVLTHGAPQGKNAIGILEVELSSDVREVGATVGFVGGDSGTFTLAASPDSAIAAVSSGAPLPTPGVRLIVTASDWRLVLNPGGDDEVLDEAAWEPPGGAATFSLVREGSQLWVIDPSGPVGHVSDPRIGELTGPWAGWALSEADGQTPVSIVALWAG